MNNNMNNLTIKFLKTHPDAQLPICKNPTDTGYDVFSVEDTVVPAKGSVVVETGITVADITEGYWFSIYPRSGMGFKGGIQPHLGILDNLYRGNASVKLYNFSDKDYSISKGDRIAQLVFFPLVSAKVEWADSVTDTTRGANGFGSSGK